MKSPCFICSVILSFCATNLVAQNPLSVSKPEADNSVAAQLASFQVAEGYEVNLFADESMGIANPVCFRWDAEGRLWVLCTWAYPQPKPGEKADDKLFILEDKDQDGKADKISTFADGLNMPTGFALGHGGVYLAEGPDLLHLRDTDGDGKADQREVLFTGFGTGDTHQNINSLTWSPGGELFFCQGLHCFSRVQTPWGIARLDEHGSWRLRPLRRQLHTYRRTSGGGNPWGYAFGDWGEAFIKSNGTGVSELLPSLVHTDHIGGGYWGGAMSIGNTKIKSMCIEIVDSPHFPDDLQGDFLIAGYYARNVARLRPTIDGAGHRLQTLAPLLTSSHNAFRPVDLNVGPDGAIYLADWFNPIIGHYQASLRHPDRDKTHGRIWRITAKGRPLHKQPALAKMSADQLCGQLADPVRRTRQLAKLRLMDLPKAEAVAAIQKWIDALKPDDPELEHKLFEAIGVFESHEVVNRPLLERLLKAKNYLARAYATRVTGRWQDRLKNPLVLLKQSAADEHPRVRLEAVVAVSDIRQAEAMTVAAQAAAGPTDRFINFAFTQAVHALSSYWKPALVEGSLAFAKPSHLVKVISTGGGADVAGVVRQQLADKELSAERRTTLVALLATIGSHADSGLALQMGAGQPEVLRALATSARERNLAVPANAEQLLGPSLAHKDHAVRAGAIELCGLWKLQAHGDAIRGLATDRKQPKLVRLSAAQALPSFKGESMVESLASLASLKETSAIRAAALGGLGQRDLPRAAQLAVALLDQVKADDMDTLLAALLQRSEGANALADALGKKKLPVDVAKLVRRWLNEAGRNEPNLVKALNAVIGVQGATPAYNSDYVATLAKEALAKGDAAKGKKIFQLPALSCMACHAVDGIASALGPIKGPNLSALAAGLPTDLIVESVLWPARQIKEGYETITITTKDGRIHSGFLQAAERKAISIRDLASGEVVVVPSGNLASRSKAQTVMPPSLTDSLTRTELRDLIKYLSTLKNAGSPK
ncbi:MAG: c-type cytochrome [Opitutae bacterium]|nr:c-type cytochrome [Opitutae bacterium]